MSGIDLYSTLRLNKKIILVTGMNMEKWASPEYFASWWLSLSQGIKKSRGNRAQKTLYK
ncbi:MAG: hypothetical protein LBL90_06765 [Prevotellaceae bacterium]|nr:hypothetical protein [Prevotellaceae bacterium]